MLKLLLHKGEEGARYNNPKNTEVHCCYSEKAIDHKTKNGKKNTGLFI